MFPGLNFNVGLRLWNRVIYLFIYLCSNSIHILNWLLVLVIWLCDFLNVSFLAPKSSIQFLSFSLYI